MITEATIRRLEEKTEAYRKDYVRRLGPGLSPQYLDARLQGFYDGSYGTEEIHQKMMQDQLRIDERTERRKKAIGSKNNLGYYRPILNSHSQLNKGGKKK